MQAHVHPVMGVHGKVAFKMPELVELAPQVLFDLTVFRVLAAALQRLLAGKLAPGHLKDQDGGTDAL